MFHWTRQQRVTETAKDVGVTPKVAIGWYTHTQAIEGHWSCTKRIMRKQGVMNTSSDLFPSYMVGCLWRRRYGDSDLFEKLMERIKDKYPF